MNVVDRVLDCSLTSGVILFCRNPFDIPRKELLSHIRRMRPNFLKAALSGIQLQEAGMCSVVIETTRCLSAYCVESMLEAYCCGWLAG